MKMTKYEEKCQRLCERLKPITTCQSEWAHRQLPAFRIAYRRKTYCSECGSDTQGRMICPVCYATFEESKVLKAHYLKAEQMYYYGIETTVGGEQVHRHFIVTKTGGVGQKAAFKDLEVSRIFINEKGSKALFTIDTRPTPYIYDCWIEGTPFKARRRKSSRFQDYRVHQKDYILFPRYYVADWLKKRGFCRIPSRYDDITWKEYLLNEPFAEWLAKKGYTHYLENVGLQQLKECKRELELADKHGYRIEDISLWADMVIMYKRCGRDTLNEKYSRPSSLKKAHDHAMLLDKRRMEEGYREKQRKKEKKYLEMRKCYFGIILSDGRYTARVIGSASEMVDEGEKG